MNPKTTAIDHTFPLVRNWGFLENWKSTASVRAYVR